MAVWASGEGTRVWEHKNLGACVQGLSFLVIPVERDSDRGWGDVNPGVRRV